MHALLHLFIYVLIFGKMTWVGRETHVSLERLNDNGKVPSTYLFFFRKRIACNWTNGQQLRFLYELSSGSSKLCWLVFDVNMNVCSEPTIYNAVLWNKTPSGGVGP